MLLNSEQRYALLNVDNKQQRVSFSTLCKDKCLQKILCTAL